MPKSTLISNESVGSSTGNEIPVYNSGTENEIKHCNDYGLPYSIDNTRFMVGAARILAALKELKGPYEACIATYGSEDHVEKVVASIVDTKRRLILDHRTWLTSEYRDEASKSVETAMDMLTDEMIDYCERSRVGKVFAIDKPFPLKELEEKCHHCGGENVRVPWKDGK